MTVVMWAAMSSVNGKEEMTMGHSKTIRFVET